MKMHLTTILAIMFTALIMHHLSPTVTAIVDHKTPVHSANSDGFQQRNPPRRRRLPALAEQQPPPSPIIRRCGGECHHPTTGDAAAVRRDRRRRHRQRAKRVRAHGGYRDQLDMAAVQAVQPG